jgi:K+/H+ antiporter YhaU regulatory subunit KhtT
MQQWTYRELVAWGLEARFTVLGIRRNGKDLLNCAPDAPLAPEDLVLLIGTQRVASITTGS